MTTPLKSKPLHCVLLSLTLIALFLALCLWGPQQLETFATDFRFAHFAPLYSASKKVVVIDVDEQSLKLMEPYYGRWPWPRRVYKDLLGFLEVGEPRAILFDILFTEKMQNADDDRLLAQVSKNLGNVSHAANLLEEGESDGMSSLTSDFEVPELSSLANPKIDSHRYQEAVLPSGAYRKKNLPIHFVTFPVDSDGVFRRAPLLFSVAGKLLPSLSLAAVLRAVEQPMLHWGESELVLHDKHEQIHIPVDRKGNLPLTFYRLDRDPETISAGSVLASALALQRGEIQNIEKLKVSPLEFRDRIVLIGGSAVGLSDLKKTPMSPAYPGVKVQATAISNILEKHFVVAAADHIQFLIILPFLLLNAIAVLMTSRTALKLGLPILLLGGFVALNFYLFQRRSLRVDIAIPSLLWGITVVEGLAFSIFVENAEKKRLHGTLAKYLSPAVIDVLAAEGKDPQAEVGSKKVLSVLFTDVRDFTSISEEYPAEWVVKKLNGYLSEMSRVILEGGGTLDKFIGDAVLAFWGAPLEEPEHAIKSLRCAFSMVKALDQLNASQWRHLAGREMPWNAGIGICTGEAIVGNIGGERRLDYTVVGDTVNVASRLEGLNKNYGTRIIIGENTFEAVRAEYRCRLIDTVQVKGKAKVLKIYEPIAAESLLPPEVVPFLTVYESGINYFMSGNYEQALAQFKTAFELARGSDRVCKIYIERCLYRMSNPQSSTQNPEKEVA